MKHYSYSYWYIWTGLWALKPNWKALNSTEAGMGVLNIPVFANSTLTTLVVMQEKHLLLCNLSVCALVHVCAQGASYQCTQRCFPTVSKCVIVTASFLFLHGLWEIDGIMLMCKCVTPLVCTLMSSIACVNEDLHKREKEKGDQRRRESCIQQCVYSTDVCVFAFPVQYIWASLFRLHTHCCSDSAGQRVTDSVTKSSFFQPVYKNNSLDLKEKGKTSIS